MSWETQQRLAYETKHICYTNTKVTKIQPTSKEDSTDLIMM